MKHLLRALFVLMLLGVGPEQRVLAQMDSLTLADTIHLTKQQAFLSFRRSYDYHYASGLSDMQLRPLLRQSTNPTTRKYVRRGQQAQHVNVGMNAAGYGLFMGGLFTPLNRPETNLSMMLSGVGLFYGSLIVTGQRARQYEKAVRSHNQFLRGQSADYYAPLFDRGFQVRPLSLADTISVVRRGLSNRYTYRGIQLHPGGQLTKLADRLGNQDVKDGLQYNRRVEYIAGLVNTLSISFLLPRIMLFGIQRANGRSATLNSPLVWGSLAGLTFGHGLRIHANRVQLQTVQLLNDRIRNQPPPTILTEFERSPSNP